METKYTLRIKLIHFFFVSLFFILLARLFYLQVVKSPFFQNLASKQYYRVVPLEGRRGTIFDRTGRILASTINSYSIFADPSFIKDPVKTAKLLSISLNLNQENLYRKLIKKSRFVWIKRKVNWADKEKITKLKLKGVGFLREDKRFYPQESLAASVLGIVDIDNKGIEGLELYCDSYLRGKNGMVRVLQDSSSHELIVSPQVITPQEGADVVLTLDAQLQYWSETYLSETIDKFGAKAGSVVVMDALSGEILALANYPTFNPNNISAEAMANIKNKAVCDMFEPGSVFKIVTLLAAIDMQKFNDSDVIFCENGSFKVPGTILNDWKPYGNLTFREVFKKSSNIGVGKIANAVGKENIYKYIKLLKFGEKTGIDIPGEEEGRVKKVSNWSKTSPYMIPIGQEVGVNLFQIARAMAVIANGGNLIKPHLVKIIASQGFYRETDSVKENILGPKTIEHAKEILIDVVNDGTGKLAKVEGLRIGGKTGTAQKFDITTGRYSPSKYRANFVGFIDYPKNPVVIAISIDEPQKSHFGGVVAASLFQKIAQSSAKYLESESAFVKNDTKKTFSPYTAQDQISQ